MNIPGKLRDDLKRIYGKIDPLNCIEDIMMKESCEGTEVHLTLRVPSSCLRYVPDTPMCRASYSLDQWAREQAVMADLLSSTLGAQKTPEKKAETRFVKPKQVFLNGNHTTIVWPDGEKTTVGVGPNTTYDEYAGFCAAIVKKLFGSSREAEKFLDRVKIVQKKKAKKKLKEMGADLEQ